MGKILVVEDDNTILGALEFTLIDEGYDVKVAQAVKEAICEIDNNDFDLILLDLMLPDGSGYDICKHVRAKSDVPVIFLTACDEEVNVVMGLELGADDYITKPFKIRELLARIKANIRRHSKSSNEMDILKIGDLEINTKEAIVKKNNQDVYLTAMEYRLILKLIQNPNAVLTRNQILESLWDTNSEFVNDNTLTVYMKRLRRKIEDDVANPKYIITVRGLGYKWCNG
ncbi:response regulator transcription factor, partial [Anaerorhabdus sp.]|uniref:response regulator transcription factor n=1 Tax=Anaerorhabdus sp. TaxID=1872524 RepID=UPI002FC79439